MLEGIVYQVFPIRYPALRKTGDLVMVLRLPSGFKIAVSPFFPWDTRSVDLTICTGRAFHPYHVTSRLCLEIMDFTLQCARHRTLLDVGCGSGIFALAAARMGVSFVVGLDIDLRSIGVSRRNADCNGLSENAHWFVGTAAAVRGPFDCIMANLPYGVVIDLAGDLGRLLGPQGHLILSGFHDIHWHQVNEKLSSVGLRIERSCSADLSFGGEPPSGSFTWMAVLAKKSVSG